LTITYQQEFLLSVEDECKPLLEEHWNEIANNKHVIKLNPDWEAYHYLEQQGALNIFTARDNGKLVGYFVTIKRANIHYKDHIFAANDIIFINKNYRKGFTGIRLIKFAEKVLKEDGVSVLVINTKTHKPFDQLLLWLNYKHIENVYSKLLGD
jgi:hypothetical protein